MYYFCFSSDVINQMRTHLGHASVVNILMVGEIINIEGTIMNTLIDKLEKCFKLLHRAVELFVEWDLMEAKIAVCALIEQCNSGVLLMVEQFNLFKVSNI